jgi:hemerythrin-like metal-binding protein
MKKIPPFVWTKELAIGIPFVDADHQVLVSLLNLVETCIDAREETFVLGSLLNALAEYTEHHFSREEKLQQVCGYAGLQEHKTIHRRLAGEVDAIGRRFETDPSSVETGEVKEFLRNWLVEHIMVHDFAYRQACVGHEQGAAAGEAIKLANGGVVQSNVLQLDRLRILVIDDNPNFLRLVATVLKAAGIRRVHTADSAMKGLEWSIRQTADVVLCDWLMRDMNGVDFALKMAEMELPSRVVLMSGCSADSFREQNVGSGVEGFLEKPISAGSLLNAVLNTPSGAA